MNTNRLINDDDDDDDDDDEYIRRPMASLTTSTTSMGSSNITIISSSNQPNPSTNKKWNENKNQSIPNSQDFPALPSTTTTSNNGKTNFVFLVCHRSIFAVITSSIWTTRGMNPSVKTSTTPKKKKSTGTNNKKFMEEVQSMASPPPLSSTHDFLAIGLSELGQRLITRENEPSVTMKEKGKKTSSLLSPSTINQETKDENKPAIQSNNEVRDRNT